MNNELKYYTFENIHFYGMHPTSYTIIMVPMTTLVRNSCAQCSMTDRHQCVCVCSGII